MTLSWHYEWISDPFVSVAMAGALLPDLNRIALLLPDATVEAALGIPFSWTPLHRVGGTFLAVCLGTELAPKRYRRAVFALLVLGAASHYLLDALLYKPSGLTVSLLWPITDHRFATPGLYLSSDRWPAVVATAVAAVVWVARKRR